MKEEKDQQIERDQEKRHKRGCKHKEHHRGAKTFRRGRALEFYARLYVKQKTLKQQLETPELQSINPIIVGELKAVETMMNEFVQLFEIHEDEIMQKLENTEIVTDKKS